jgi:hypothetical protein
MAVKKKTTNAGPKALLMKKNVDQLKRKAKQLGVKNYSTKKKAQLVQSIMLAEARKKKKPTRKKALTSKTSAKKKTRKISSAIKRPAENSPMVKALEVMDPYTRRKAMKMYGMSDRRNNRQMAQRSFYEANFEGFGLRELYEAGMLLTLYADNKLSQIAQAFFGGGEIKVGFNAMYGNVFLYNEDNETLMRRGNKLDLFITLPYGGEEGFIDELYDIYDELDDDDKEALDDYKQYK